MNKRYSPLNGMSSMYAWKSTTRRGDPCESPNFNAHESVGKCVTISRMCSHEQSHLIKAAEERGVLLKLANEQPCVYSIVGSRDVKESCSGFPSLTSIQCRMMVG